MISYSIVSCAVFPHKVSAEATLQMFGGIYRDFAGKSECGDFKFTGIACIPAIPVIFEVNQKSVDFLYIQGVPHLHGFH